VVQPGTRINQMMSHQDWLPTLLAAAGEPNIKERLAEGHQAGDKTFRVHLDGYNFLPYFKGETGTGPREEYLYFSQGGELNAVRWNDWKVHFAVQRGNIATSTRDVTGWPTIVNLRADPFERAPDESGMYIRWYAENIWLFIPVQQKLQEFFKGFMEYPYQLGSSLNAANISYQTLRLAEAQRRLGELEELPPPRN
jgi:arylsulfatase A-like enzyme